MKQLVFIPPVIAHRGASAYAPENTMAAFNKAVELGLNWIEFDVMQAACGKPIIFHDEMLERTTNGFGEMRQYTYSYLHTLDAGSWFNASFKGEKIPSLQEVMSFIKKNKMAANIEIKAWPGQEKNLVIRIYEEMVNFSFSSQPDCTFLFSSFSVEALWELRKQDSHCMIGLLLHEWLPDWEKICQDLNCVSVHVNHKILTPKTAEKIKSMNKKLLCYTVNRSARALKLYQWGVDAVFSDVPDKIAYNINKNFSQKDAL